MMKNAFSRIDKPTFFGALFLLFLVVVPLILFPVKGAQWIDIAKHFMTEKLGIVYLALGLAAIFFMVYIIFSDIGQIKLGEVDEEPEFSTLSWGAMLFCGGLGASILYWGMIEWAYYYSDPPFQIAAGSHEAVRWASTYGLFHWGPIAWSIYMIPAIPIAYFYYVRKQPVLKISSALMPVIGEQRAKGWIGKLIDISFIFGMLGGAATTLGLAAPLITEGLHHLFGTPRSTGVQIIVLLICTAIFAYSAYVGLEKGIKFLSNINFWGAMGLLAFILVCGPTRFMLETGLDSIGRVLGNFFHMATWAEPFRGLGGFEQTNFPQDWTIFYWAWWLVYAPSMGIFVARISRGRTIKQMVAGAIFFGSTGCFAFFIILGNYGLYLQLEGSLDVVNILQNQGATPAIFAILETMPASYLVISAFTLLCIIFTATTFDSISFILASAVQNDVTDDPMRWNRLFWAFALSFLPATLMLLDANSEGGGKSLATLQTAAIVGGLPLLVIAVMLMISTVKAAHLDLRHQADYSDSTINIESVPEFDPWSQEGIALAKFEKLRDGAQESAEAERNIYHEIYLIKKKMRAYALEHSDDPNHHIPEDMQNELDSKMSELAKSSEAKQDLSQQAQLARMEFDNLLKT